MSLSAADLAYVRSFLPTVDDEDRAYVTEDQLNYLYTNKADSDTDKTIALALRQMCIKMSYKVGRSNTATGDTQQQQQEREAVCTQADLWAAQTGIGAGAVTAGSISLGIDEEDSEFSNP